MKITINMEEDSQFQKADDLLKDINSLSSSNDIDGELKSYLTDYSYIRIMQPKNKVVGEVMNDSLLSKK
jgi:hypothetical protein